MRYFYYLEDFPTDIRRQVISSSWKFICQCKMCGPIEPPPQLMLGGFTGSPLPHPLGHYAKDPFEPVLPSSSGEKRQRTTYIAGAQMGPDLPCELLASLPLDHATYRSARRGEPTRLKTEIQTKHGPGYKANHDTTSNDIFDDKRSPFMITLFKQWQRETKARMQAAAETK